MTQDLNQLPVKGNVPQLPIIKEATVGWNCSLQTMMQMEEPNKSDYFWGAFFKGKIKILTTIAILF